MSIDYEEWNGQVILMHQALVGSISPNFRMVALDYESEDGWILKFYLEKYCIEDLEEIEEIVCQYDAWQDSSLRSRAEIIIGNGRLPEFSEVGRTLFRRKSDVCPDTFDPSKRWPPSTQTGRGENISIDSEDWNGQLLFVSQALAGSVSPNFRMVILDYDNEDGWLLKFYLKGYYIEDLERIGEIVCKYAARQDSSLRYRTEIIIGSGRLPDFSEAGRAVTPAPSKSPDKEIGGSEG